MCFDGQGDSGWKLILIITIVLFPLSCRGWARIRLSRVPWCGSLAGNGYYGLFQVGFSLACCPTPSLVCRERCIVFLISWLAYLLCSPFFILVMCCLVYTWAATLTIPFLHQWMCLHSFWTTNFLSMENCDPQNFECHWELYVTWILETHYAWASRWNLVKTLLVQVNWNLARDFGTCSRYQNVDE